MKLTFVKEKVDILVALFVLVSCASLSVVCYARLQQIERPEEIPFRDISEGESRYYAVNRGSCVGLFDVVATHETLYQINVKGKLRILLPGKEHVASIEVISSFNPLGQLFHSRARIYSPDYSLELTAENINPLNLSVSAKTGTHSYFREFSLPGPVLISRNPKDSSFRIDYFYLEALETSQLIGFSQSLRDNLSVRVILEESAVSKCTTESLRPLDLTQPINALRSFLTKLQGKLIHPGRK